MSIITRGNTSLRWEEIVASSSDAPPSGVDFITGDSLDILPTVWASLHAGRCAAVIPSFFPPVLQEQIKSTVGPFGGPHAALISSGSSGQPSVNAVTPLFMLPRILGDSTAALSGVMPERIATTAPIETSAIPYMTMLAMGRDIEVLPPRSPHADFIKVAEECDGVAVRPSYIAALAERGLRLDGKTVMTSTAPLTPEVEGLIYDLGAKRIVDLYVASEIGTIAYRRSSKDLFTIMPHVKAEADDYELVLAGPTVAGYYSDGRFIERGECRMGDTGFVGKNALGLVSTTHTKAKVSGYSVPLEYVASVVKAVGDSVVEARAEVHDGALSVTYTGSLGSRATVWDRLQRALPWYWIPEEIVEGEVEVPHASESWSHVPVPA